MKSKQERGSYNVYKFMVLGDSVVSECVLSINFAVFIIENNTPASDITALHRLGTS